MKAQLPASVRARITKATFIRGRSVKVGDVLEMGRETFELLKNYGHAELAPAPEEPKPKAKT